VYTLLIQYRVRRLEDYDGDEEQAMSQLNQRPPVVEEKLSTAEPTRPLLLRVACKDTQAIPKTEGIPVRTIQSPDHPTPAGPRAPPSKVMAQATSTTPQSPQSNRQVQEAPWKTYPPLQKNNHESPQLPPIVVSELGGQSIEQFFSEVAQTVDFNQHSIHLGQSRSNIPTIREPPSLRDENEDDGRFADADEDASSASDSAFHRGSVMTTRTATPQLHGESSPGIPGFGLGISTQGGPHRRYTFHAPMPANAFPVHAGPTLHLQGSPERMPVRKSDIPPNSMLATPTPISIRPAPQAMDRMEGTSSDKENVGMTVARPRAGTISNKQSTGGGTHLERRRTLGDRRVQIVLPGEEVKFGQKYSHPSEPMLWKDSSKKRLILIVSDFG